MSAASRESDGPAEGGERTRLEILEASMRLFQHFGFGKTTMADIARETDMSPGNLYRYYRNKQAIGRAVTERYFRMTEAQMATGLMLPGGSPAERIRELIKNGVGHLLTEMDRNPRLVELAEFICADPEGFASLQEHIAWKEKALTREIGRGIEVGQFRKVDPVQAGRVLVAATRAYWMPMALVHIRREEDGRPALLDEVIDLMLAGLMRPDA
ncbi:MAG: TetR/AcrR family transcriptional regulator [Pseudomonadota bacterium]